MYTFFADTLNNLVTNMLNPIRSIGPAVLINYIFAIKYYVNILLLYRFNINIVRTVWCVITSVPSAVS